VDVDASAVVVDRREVFARTFFLVSVVYLGIPFTAVSGAMVWNWADRPVGHVSSTVAVQTDKGERDAAWISRWSGVPRISSCSRRCAGPS
jgi:hypothetical protein